MAPTIAQDTFSIVAVDTLTGEIGSAGASCVGPINGVGAFILSDVLEGIGAIHTQSFWDPTNQQNARARMLLGDSPQEIIDWLVANDVAGNPSQRQYGIVDLSRDGESAAFTGVNCFDYKGQHNGPGFSVQGNILLGPVIIDTMVTTFQNTPGPLADRLMATLEAAKIIGADTRCASRNTSSQSSFIKVVRIGDGNTPYLQEIVPDSPVNVDPIDLLRIQFDQWKTGLYGTPDPFLSQVVADVDSLPAGDSLAATITIIPRNNSDSLLTNSPIVRVRNSGDGLVGTVEDLGNGTFQVPLTPPASPGRDTLTVSVVTANDSVVLATRPVIHFFLTTGIKTAGFYPTEFQLLPNYPNPFNPETRVRFRLKKNAAVNLVIRDIQGKRIRDLADREWYPAGDHQIVWDGKNERGFSASSGVYMIEMTVDGRRLAQRMVLIR
ncbi:MAG TPA: DUF1028 domain-containing protein [Calditrichia bacterium]|nr:DUF1028 domain-containing protein [Calditrichia bacterium]